MQQDRQEGYAPSTHGEVQLLFDGIAPIYDGMNRVMTAGRDQRWRRALVEWLPPPVSADETLLDVATGTGDIIWAARRRDRRSWIGVDLSEGMLAVAQRKAEARGESICWQVGRAEQLHLDSDSVAAVTVAFGLRNCVDKMAALREFHRVLRRGGHLLILELMPNPVRRRGFQFYFERMIPVLGRLLGQEAAYRYLPRTVSGFYTASELVDVAARLGFRLCRRRGFAFGICQLFDFVAESAPIPNGLTQKVKDAT